MNAPLAPSVHQAHQLTEALALACDRIAPTWPLDRFIAVNPYWGWIGQPMPEAAARLGVLAGAPLTMPRAWFRVRWQAGHLQRQHLEEVARRHGDRPTAEDLVAALEAPDAPAPPLPRLPMVSALCDAAWPDRGQHWSDLVTHQISQHCAAWFDDAQARWGPPRAEGLYRGWLRQLAADRGLPWPDGRRSALARIAALPTEPGAAIAQALASLGIAASAHADYLSAALLSINGWAAWCAHARCQARLQDRDDGQLIELAAIRMAWELLLAQVAEDAGAPVAGPDWAASWSACEARSLLLAREQRVDWRLQEALELAYQQPLSALLARPADGAAVDAAPQVQAVFCIDVRSERLRRALEAADAGVHTRGFAGFFGLPVAWQPTGSALVRPQLPGLLAPALTLHDGPLPAAEGAPLGGMLAARRQQALHWSARWNALRTSAASGFSFVETCGLAYGAKLLADSLPSERAPARWEDTGLPPEARGQAPQLPLADSDPAAAATLVAGILRAMGLPDRQHGFAPLVLLAGHGSRSANNPHAAGLDCGACGGQTGEANARALAGLLNAPAVRNALAAQGLAIPPGTYFLAALHNTTTDEVLLYDDDQVPAALAVPLAQLRRALEAAGRRTRAERAPALGLAALAGQPEALARALRTRANDWSQVRPEWGLADCAAFIVAPRARTRGLDLQGRAFLHDYDHRQDGDLRVLELIMTAPMVVTHWINLQYHASTVDNRRFGSGNKLLHNVVGGHIGVFEGNGGDLRIGLPLQSLHDGQVLRHTPLRLSVFIEAPRAALETVIARHAVVRDLVDHGWLHLLRIDPEHALVEQRRAGAWVALAPAPATAAAAAATAAS